MISILSSGTLIEAATPRRSDKTESAFVNVQMKSGNGSALISLIAFDEVVCKALLAFSNGYAFVVQRAGKPSQYTSRNGEEVLALSVVVSVLMTAYSYSKKMATLSESRYCPAWSPLHASA